MNTVGLRRILPPPQHQYQQHHQQQSRELANTTDAPLYSHAQRAKEANKVVPSYGRREGWIPRSVKDFGDGGSFPEIHVPQHPLEMGRNGAAPATDRQMVALSTDSEGKVNYDAVVKQGHHKGAIVFSKASDLKDKNFTDDELAKPGEEEQQKAAERAMELINAKMNRKAAVHNPANHQALNAKYIRYTPQNSNPAHNSGATQRIIRMVDRPVDPLDPPKFKNVKVHAPPGSPPVPVMHSPPKDLTKEERDAWNVPSCVSNWKNPKGYMIPLDKRLAADGRNLQENSVSDRFAKLNEALTAAERNAREEVSKRLNIKRELEKRQQQEQDEQIRQVAQQARLERSNIARQAEQNETREERIQRIERERIRETRRLEREREHRLAQRGRTAKKSKASRDLNRDISQKIALGEAVPKNKESVFDSRLFNTTGGMASGFGDDDDYNVYDSQLFGEVKERTLYKAPVAEDNELYGGGQSIDEIANTKRFKPHKDFSGVDRESGNVRSGPVTFQRGDSEEPDVLDHVDQFLEQAKNKTNKRQELGVMHAVGGGSGAAEEYRGRNRNNKGIDFVEAPGQSAGDDWKRTDRNRDDNRHRDNRQNRDDHRDERHRDGRQRENRQREDRHRDDRHREDRHREDRHREDRHREDRNREKDNYVSGDRKRKRSASPNEKNRKRVR